MGGAVNAVLEETLYVLTIAGVLVVQWFTHTAEHKAHHHRQVSETLAMMYRELTVLGIVVRRLPRPNSYPNANRHSGRLANLRP